MRIYVRLQVFVSWKNLCRKRFRKISMIPLPVSPAASMPSVGSVSSPFDSMTDPFMSSLESPQNKTPSANLFSSQQSCENRSRSKLPTLNARNSPVGSTGSGEKLSAYKSTRRGSLYWMLCAAESHRGHLCTVKPVLGSQLWDSIDMSFEDRWPLNTG